MKQRWILFYDGACPLCFKSQSKLISLIDKNIKLTAVDLNSSIAKSKGYDNKQVVLETPVQNYYGYHAWLKLLEKTKHKYFTFIGLRPLFILAYYIISKNRSIISKFIKL